MHAGDCHVQGYYVDSNIIHLADTIAKLERDLLNLVGQPLQQQCYGLRHRGIDNIQLNCLWRQ